MLLRCLGIFTFIKYIEFVVTFLVLSLLYRKYKEEVFIFMRVLFTFLTIFILIALTVATIWHSYGIFEIIDLGMIEILVVVLFEMISLIIMIHAVEVYIRNKVTNRLSRVFYLRWVFCILIVFLSISLLESGLVALIHASSLDYFLILGI